MAALDQIDAGHPHVVRATAGLISYLRDLVQKSRTPVRDCTQYLDMWWLARMPNGTKVTTSPRDGTILALDHEPQHPAPRPPELLTGWVDLDQVDDIDAEPELGAPSLLPSPDMQGERELASPVGTHTTHHPASSEVLRTYGDWITAWRAWAEAERAARPRRELYKRLSQTARKLSQNDDTLEAVLGLGLLTFESPEGELTRRHLVTTTVQISIDRATARVSITLADEPDLRVEDRLFLDAADRFELDRVQEIRRMIADSGPQPPDEQTMELLQAWLHRAFDRPVRFSESWDPPETFGEPAVMTTAPAIIVRRRDRTGLVEYYESILESLETPGAMSPLGLSQLLFELEPEQRMAWRAQAGTSADRLLGDDPLFPLPTNEAQRAVFERLARDTAVVVQGPPGTGKTHTIANLMAALLAEGKRILVTSAKDQALRVLRDALPAQLQDLCVRQTHGYADGSDELERTLTTLSDQAVTRDPDGIRQRITHLEAERRNARRRQAKLREDAYALRESETVTHRIAPGYVGTRADLIESVRAGEPRYGWMPALPPEFPLRPPLSPAEALELRTWLADDQLRANVDGEYLPDLTRLPTPETFAGIAKAAGPPADDRCRPSPLEAALARLGELRLNEVASLLDAAADVIHRLGLPQDAGSWDPADWRTRAILDQLSGTDVSLWRHAAAGSAMAAEFLQEILDHRMLAVDTSDLSDADAARMITAGEELVSFLRSGGELRSRFAKPVQRDAAPLLDRCKVDGHNPRSASDLEYVIRQLRARTAAAKAVHSWRGLGIPIPAGDLHATLSRLQDKAEKWKEIGSLKQIFERIDALLLRSKIRYPIRTPTELGTLVDCVCAADAGARARHATQRLNALTSVLTHPVARPAPETQALCSAVEQRRADLYAQALGSVQHAYQRRAQHQQCRRLLARLHSVHGALAEQLVGSARDQAWEERLADLDGAWGWAVAQAFCERLDHADADQSLQVQLAEAEQQVMKTTAELCAERAWLHCLTRMSEPQRQALQTYKHRMSDLGKGTSRRYGATYRSAVRQAMSRARNAVPAWIMPLSLVVETLPPEPDSFDVVIVDEASQVSVDAAFLLWLAPHVIVVGDDQQCSPPDISHGALQPIFDRLETYLPDVPLDKRLELSPKSNLYKLLSARFPQVVRLVDHFRCMPEIIGWSSRQFYDNRLVPLRQYGDDRLSPLKVVHVEGAYTEGAQERIRNEIEAKAIIERLKELLAAPEYVDKTFGIIVLHGGFGQLRLLEQMLDDEINDPGTIEARDIRVGTPADFQGDARDVIFLSMVVCDTPRRVGGSRSERQRFNVAASRARDQMWLFTSVPSQRLHPEDLRYSLLTYMSSPPALVPVPAELGNVRPDVPHQAFQSLFEQRVFLHIRNRGYHVIPQMPAGNGKVIDLVVVGTRGRLGVECDGRRWHRAPDQVRQDIARELELRRAGWELWRIREGDFVLDAERALEPLWTELHTRGIHPGSPDPETSRPPSTWLPIDLPETQSDTQDEE
ncbi:AAA domain-containing protein [Spirillospora sp. NPDC048911]|uniref:AAA domain-containing protein n=1 Tax=Spirillospora sp. NPDC048911 TaxID=3364527 RepID=UPI0037110177